MKRKHFWPEGMHQRISEAHTDRGRRGSAIVVAIGSGNPGVIQRLVEFVPLDALEARVIREWAESQLAEGTQSKDFLFWFLIRTCLPYQRREVAQLICEYGRYDTVATGELTSMIVNGAEPSAIKAYLKHLAWGRVSYSFERARDWAYHFLIDLSETQTEWEGLAKFLIQDVSDIRPGVLESFLKQCPDGPGLTVLTEAICGTCSEMISSVGSPARQDRCMGFILDCFERLRNEQAWIAAAQRFKRFNYLPFAVSARISLVD